MTAHLVTPDTAPEPASDTPPADINPETGRPRKGPGSRGPRKAKKTGVSDAALREALSDLLQAPAVPYSMFRDDWGANHVLRTGPELAGQLVALSKTAPAFRAQLEHYLTGDTALATIMASIGVAIAAAAYLVPQLAHFGLIPTSLGERFVEGNIPPTPRNATPSHDSTTPRTEGPEVTTA